jgi:hypothetical protein
VTNVEGGFVAASGKSVHLSLLDWKGQEHLIAKKSWWRQSPGAPNPKHMFEHLTAAAREILDAVGVLKTLKADNARKVPADAPIGFIKKRWEGVVFTEGGMERRFYERCVLAELKIALRSGDIWVHGSRQFKDFDEYLLPAGKFASLRAGRPIAARHRPKSHL